ncbi:MAG: DNA polymerase III subunit delta [Candidatus Paceibacterota bacterium]
MQNEGKNIKFWFGSDNFSMLEVLREEKLLMLQKNKNADIADFDFSETESRFDLENRIKEALRGNSLFSSDKLTVIRNFWSSQRKTKKSEDDAEKDDDNEKQDKKNDFENFLLSYIEQISSQDKIFFLEKKNLDKRSRAYKTFENMIKNGKIQRREFAMPVGFKLNIWLAERIEKKGGKISKSNLDLLAMFLGKGMEQKERNGDLVVAYDLYQAAGEIDKLIAYCDGKEIERSDIFLLVSTSSDMNIFNLIESIGKKDKARALAILSGQIKEGFNENYILTMLVYHFRNLINIKSFLDRGFGASEIAKRTRMHPMVVEKNISYARNLKENYLVMIYEKLYGADLSIKTGKMEPELALDLLLAVI